MAYSEPDPRVPSEPTRFWLNWGTGHLSQPNPVAYESRFFSNPSLANEVNVGSRMRSGGLSLARTRGVSLMRFVNWSCVIFHVTFGYCFVNSAPSLKGRSKPVSKYAFNFPGAVPQPAVPPEAAPDEVAVEDPGAA